MEVVIGSTLLKLAVSIEESGSKFQCTKHILTFLRDNSGFKRSQSSKSLWKLFLSPGAEYLLLLRDGSRIPTSPWDQSSIAVDIFQDLGCRRSPMKPKFIWVTWKFITVSAPRIHTEDDNSMFEPTTLQPFDNVPQDDEPLEVKSTEIRMEHAVSLKAGAVMHFHPALPQIIYSYGSGTYIWNFCFLLHSTTHQVYQEHIKVHHSALSNIRIADSGNLLYGFESVNGKERVVVLNLEPYQRVFVDRSTRPAPSQILGSTKSVVKHLEHVSLTDLVKEASSQAQPSDTAMLVMTPSGTPALSILRQSKENGSLVQETFDTEGNTSARNILHIPSSIYHDTDVTLLSPGEYGSQNTSDSVNVLLGVRPRSTYTFAEASKEEPLEQSLPVMFRRDEISIRTLQGQVQHVVECTVVPRMMGSATPDQSDLPAIDDSGEEDSDSCSSVSTNDCDFFLPLRRTPSPVEIGDMGHPYPLH